jgi:hypothetical protein
MRNILTKEVINQIDEVCKKYNIAIYSINSDGSIDVDGEVNLNYKNLKELPLKFGKVRGDFNCGNNRLTSLEGCPSSLGGFFDCGSNELTSLEFSPIKVGGNFSCHGNQLPRHFIDLYDNLNPDEFKIFLKYQHDLRIWDNNGYKEESAQDLFDEIKDGML